MRKVHQKRLLNVAKALRESKNPKMFKMSQFVHGDNAELMSHTADKNICGTPACALGHYAARRDLQKLLTIEKEEKTSYFGKYPYARVVFTDGQQANLLHDDRTSDHFGIGLDEMEELFSGAGCGNAETPKQAARYIEKFVARKIKDQKTSKRAKRS